MPPSVYRVAILGGITATQGLDVLEALVHDAIRRRLPLHFVVIGPIERRIAQWPDAPLHVTGTYPDDRLDELVALERPDALLFLAQVPQAHSFNLTVAQRARVPVFAPDLGAFPERLDGDRDATLFAWNAQPTAVNDALLARLQRVAHAARVEPA
jgi:hypothetical protein